MTLFTEALGRADPAERAAYLDRACGGDADLQKRVEALLAAHAGARHFLEPDATGAIEATSPGPSDATRTFTPDAPPPSSMATGEYWPDGPTRTFAPADPNATTGLDAPAPRASAEQDAISTVIAERYTLVGTIGEGGMGAVYLAEQTEPVKRQVALKLIKAGMDSKGVLARFDAERQALALMDHPNIARIYDGGVTEKGQPFFVMELVRGVPLTEYCDRERLSVKARLELFVSVCQAVQHAHQKGIIHRDLKPGNVLVTEVDGRPTPKVIDFGVAKATEQKLTDMTFSDAGAIVGTPAYMSPEQANPASMDIDTRSDVYALGVILYELLTGAPPIDAKQFKRGAIPEILRMVREVEAPKPSTKLSTAEALPNIAANRNIEPAKLAKLLQGELDWVVLKALEKDRNRRYDSALGFAQDVQRYLADEVVEARPPSRGYRLRKFVKRNRVQVIAAALVFVALVAGVVGTSLGMVRAEDERADAVKARDGEKNQREKAEGLADTNGKLAVEKGKLADDNGKLAIDNGKLADAERTEKNKNKQLADDNAKLAAEEREAKEETGRQLARVQAIMYTNHMTKVAQVIDKNPAEALALLYDLDLCPVKMRDTAWNVAVKQCQRFLVSTVAPIEIIEAFSHSRVAPDGSRQAIRRVVRRDEAGQYWVKVTIFDLNTRKEIAMTPEFLDADGRSDMRFSDNGSKLLILTRNDVPKKMDPGPVGLDTTFRAYVCDTATGKLTVIQEKASVLFSQYSKFSPDSRLIASPRLDNSVVLWNIETNKEMHVFGGPGTEPIFVFSPDNRFLAVLGTDNNTVLWDLETNKQKHVFKDHGTHPIYAFSPDGKSFAVGGRDSVIKIWDIASGQLQHTLSAEKQNAAPDFVAAKRAAELTNPKDDGEQFVGIGSLDFSPDGKRLAVACNNWLLEIWDLTSGKLRVTLRPGKGVYGVRFYGDGSRLLINGGALVDVSTGQQLLALPGGGQLSKDGRTIIAQDFNSPIKTYDPEVQLAEQAKMTFDKLKRPMPIFALGLRGRLMIMA